MVCAPSTLPPEGHQLLAQDTHVTIEEQVRVRLTFQSRFAAKLGDSLGGLQRILILNRCCEWTHNI